MATAFRPRAFILFLGDIVFFLAALWLALFVRTFTIPGQNDFLQHLTPFLFLFAAWVVVFFIAGLYETRSIILARRALSATLLVAQTFNITLAAVFFFLIPLFGIAPKTLLFIYLCTSFPLVLLWRAWIFPWLGLQKQESAVAVGSRDELLALVRALDEAPRAPARVAAVVDPLSPTVVEDIKLAVAEHRARFVIADFSDPLVLRGFPEMYNFLAAGVRFFDAMDLYETVFGRVPLSIITERWLARNVSRQAHAWYDSIKRLMDIVIGLVGGLASLVFYPFIILAIKLDDGGPIFVSLPRVGKDGQIVYIKKFRSMSGNDSGDYGAGGTTKLAVTRVGRVLRKTSLDELPQFWNVIIGKLSLIGPRPETPALAEIYRKEIPYYDMRHLITPGISGWAQLYHANDPHHGTEVEATREKLSYDLYYLKHRSLLLDVVIAMKTIKKLLTRSGA
ncbi:MAG TPA: sugar transferase [Candidatus Paceibacterota bacterium]|nr:sugar transferase [Candidatus Paceibacterota bacterium]